MSYSNTNYTDPAFREYQENLRKLGPVNTNERAKEYQRLFEEFHNIRLSVQP